MRRKVIFRADAGKNVGYGHFFRSLALAGYLKDDYECCFASYNHDLGQLSEFQIEEIEKVASPLLIAGSCLEDFDKGFADASARFDIAVLDNYYFSTQYLQEIKSRGCKLVCIDDMHGRHLPCDLLITPSPLRREDFSLEPGAMFAGGIEWAFLREPFLRPQKIREHSPIERVVIAMGGADPLHLTDKMAEMVRGLLPDATIAIIAGETVRLSDATGRDAEIFRNISAEKIADIFDEADLGIFPASTVCIEAISRGLPAAAGYFADNQAGLYEYGATHRYFIPLGNLIDPVADIAARLKRGIGKIPLYTPAVDFGEQKRKFIKLFEDL